MMAAMPGKQKMISSMLLADGIALEGRAHIAFEQRADGGRRRRSLHDDRRRRKAESMRLSPVHSLASASSQFELPLQGAQGCIQRVAR